jgi:tyrosine-protein kinase Etk/Wzc
MNGLVRAGSAGFDILPTAAPDTRAADALVMPAFARLIGALRAEYDLVLSDTPPVGAISDARTIAAEADMTLLVVRLDRTRSEEVQQALANLGHGARGDLYKTRPPKIGGFVLTGRRSAR